jgi:hypothetical protein
MQCKQPGVLRKESRREPCDGRVVKHDAEEGGASMKGVDLDADKISWRVSLWRRR